MAYRMVDGKLLLVGGKLTTGDCCCDPVICSPAGINEEIVNNFSGSAFSLLPVLFTVTDAVDPCGSIWTAANPRSAYNSTIPPTAPIDTFISSYAPTNIYWEGYRLACERRRNIFENNLPNLSSDPADVEWYFSGSWGGPELGTGNPSVRAGWIRITPSQGAAYRAASSDPWTSVAGGLTIVTLNPFYAIATFTPASAYPSIWDNCGPVTVEVTE